MALDPGSLREVLFFSSTVSALAEVCSTERKQPPVQALLEGSQGFSAGALAGALFSLSSRGGYIG